MARATNGPASRARRKRILLRAKGFRGFRSKLFRYAKDAVYKAWQYEYRDRKKRKGQFRRLWTARISAAVRPLGLTYSRFMEGLKAANVDLDRKSLSELAIANPEAFKAVFEQAKKAGRDITVLYDKFTREPKADDQNVKYFYEGSRFYTVEVNPSLERGYEIGFKAGKHELFPFPFEVASKNANLVQNPGW